MATYSINDPEKGAIRHKDRKRLLWLNSTLMPIYPLAGIGAFMLTGTQWYLLIPLIINYKLSLFWTGLSVKIITILLRS